MQLKNLLSFSRITATSVDIFFTLWYNVTNYNNYLIHKEAFSEDFQFACRQDFSHINDIYKKVDDIYKEGIFNYLLVSKCRDTDLDYFTSYEADGLEVLILEEE